MEYNGHASWEHWNVALWINNDEGLYNLAAETVRMMGGDYHRAAEYLMDMFREAEIKETPDGAPYTVETIEAAIDDIEVS